MMRMLYIMAFTLMTLCVTEAARAEFKALTVDLAEDHVDITTGFDGARLVLFGTKKSANGDVAVIVRGPSKNMVVRKKNAVLGAWMNTEFVAFDDVPGFYDFSVSDNISKRVDMNVLKEAGVGKAALVFAPEETEGMPPERLATFQQALVRNKQSQHLFAVQPKKVKHLNDHFFRTELYLPANVPKGEYTVETLVFVNNRIAERHETTLMVGQVGASATVFMFSKTNGLAYGLICVLIAVLAGWGINSIRRAA